MFKKYFVPLVSVMVLALLVVSPAAAAGDGRTGIRVRGEVTAVDAGAGKFRLETRDGETLTFFVSEKTRYLGQLGGLADLEVGWKAGVGAFENEDGQLQAVVVIAGDPEDRPEGRHFPPQGQRPLGLPSRPDQGL